jgi:hypothetical protein
MSTPIHAGATFVPFDPSKLPPIDPSKLQPMTQEQWKFLFANWQQLLSINPYVSAFTNTPILPPPMHQTIPTPTPVQIPSQTEWTPTPQPTQYSTEVLLHMPPVELTPSGFLNQNC